MSDNAPDENPLPERNEPYELPPLRHPQGIDGEPHEALDAALDEFETLLIAVTGYAQRVEALTRAAMLSEAVTLPKDGPLAAGDVSTYPERTYELNAVARANSAIGIALDMVTRGRRELAKPIADSRRLER